MNKNILGIIILTTMIILSGCGNNEKSASQSSSSKVLDMQGYELETPRGYTCTGGFTDGYRYMDAKCEPSRGQHEITVEAGLAVSGINPAEGLVANQIVVRSYEFTKQYGVIVCEPYHSEDLKLDAEHYICLHEMDGKRTITIGTGKSRSNHGWWFESHLQTKPTDETTNEEYAETLTKFLNSAIKIDWNKYE